MEHGIRKLDKFRRGGSRELEIRTTNLYSRVATSRRWDLIIAVQVQFFVSVFRKRCGSVVSGFVVPPIDSALINHFVMLYSCCRSTVYIPRPAHNAVINRLFPPQHTSETVSHIPKEDPTSDTMAT